MKGLTFYLEILSEGNDRNSIFQTAVIDHGGKVSYRLGKHISYLVWSQGRASTLKKAMDYEGIKIVSSLWF